jgi:glycosyltransferase involved in cell wall biosynthesis
MGLRVDRTYVLFSGSFDTPVKNASLAKQAVSKLQMERDIELIELKGYNREEVNLLMNACDCGLLTSLREGSPMFIKELMAANRPLVSVDVGDVRDVIEPVDGCFIAESRPENVASGLKKALKFSENEGFTEGRERIKELHYDIDSVANRLAEIYHRVLAEE